MKKRRLLLAVAREDLLNLFSRVDQELSAKGQKLIVTVMGGASIILQGFRDRVTQDIDIAYGKGAEIFRQLCERQGIPVDIISIASTVDFNQQHTLTVFQGKALTVQSVTPEDLIKLKLERFRKQDPEDIYAILERTRMSYEKFASLAKEMLLDFIGNPRELILSARLVIERMYPDKIREFDPAGNHSYRAST